MINKKIVLKVTKDYDFLTPLLISPPKSDYVIYGWYLTKKLFVGEHLEDLAFQMEAVVPNYKFVK